MDKQLSPLEALRYIKYGFMEEVDMSIIEKALKALEIIKEKGLDIREFRYASFLYEYNICKNIGCKELTQQE